MLGSTLRIPFFPEAGLACAALAVCRCFQPSVQVSWVEGHSFQPSPREMYSRGFICKTSQVS